MKNNYLTKTLFYAWLPLLFLSAKGNAQYSVSAIPHQTYSAVGATTLNTTDDNYSEVLALPFNFSFFGNSYNQIVISTNGYIDFRTSLAGQSSPWSFSSPIPNASFPVKNAILACFHDMNNNNASNVGGSITYSTIGVAPFRKFILIFTNQPHFGTCTTLRSTFQTVLYETLNTIDVQIVNKPVCVGWNGGNAVTGIINNAGTIAFAPPGRNTGPWTATQEGWRFSLPMQTNTYKYSKCDANSDGLETFNLQVVKDDLSAPGMVFYETIANLQDQAFPMPLLYDNIIHSEQVLYADNNGQVTEVILRTVNCNVDYDLDAVATALEDLNGDGNLENDDTDADGIPNFLDNDDDGDMILTSFEYAFSSGRNSNDTNSVLDTDNDGIPNYLDNDDDGDGVLTINEDYNGNNNPGDDDTNDNGIPDFLESSVALGVDNPALNSLISLYPNPVSNMLTIDNRTNEVISNIAIYSINGMLVKQVANAGTTTSIPVSELQTGMYFVKMQVGNQVMNYKFIKK